MNYYKKLLLSNSSEGEHSTLSPRQVSVQRKHYAERLRDDKRLSKRLSRHQEANRFKKELANGQY